MKASLFRPWLVVWHRWFGLVAAGFLTVAGLTGAVIAWDHEIDAWLNPTLYTSRSQGTPQPALALARQLEAADPRLQVSWMPLSTEPGHTLMLWVVPRIDPRTGQAHVLGFNQVALDPVTGEVQGRRAWGAVSLSREHIVPFLYKLHYSLHLPEAGGIEWGVWGMGLLAVAWVVDALVALWLSFPKLSQWRRSFSFRWGQGQHKVVFDLHRSGGVWVWGAVLVLAVSAVALNLGEQVMRPIVNWFSPLTPRVAETLPPVPSNALATLAQHGDAVLARATQIAREEGWHAPPGSLYLRPQSNAWAVSFHEAGLSHGDMGLGNVQLDLDARTGRILGKAVPGEGSPGDVFLQAMFPLHSGRIAGLPGRIAVTVLGLLIAVLCVTGVILWARKRRARHSVDQALAGRAAAAT